MKTVVARCSNCWLNAVLLISSALWLQGCRQEATPELKSQIVGDWEEVHGTKETLHFKADGTLIMKSPSEFHQCVYDFPDEKQIRMNCAPAGSPAYFQVWNLAFTDDDKLQIGTARETGTYRRQE
ncbi:MAG TPA: hypothetical protein VN875_17440 [Candidatus Binatus sp.]|jgi:hypothetical protein|nr:hypothetical protein [Candidatus Binatus sp.]